MSPKIPFSILELAVISSGSTIKQTFSNTLALAKEAEQLGYHRFWLAEHHNSQNIASTATTVLIGYVAGGTKTIHVGSGGIMLPNHSPLIVAEQFGTLGNLYLNRIDLGVGRAPGTDPATANAIRPDRLQAVHNFPADIRKIQEYFDPANASSTIRVNVAEGVNVGIYILGSSTDSAHLAAEMGLPYAFASHFATGQFDAALAIYKKNFKPSKFLDKPYIIATINVIAANTDAEAEAHFTSLIRMFLGVLTGSREPLQPPTPMTDDLRETLEHPALKEMLRYSFVGRKDVIAKQLKEFVNRTGANELMIVTNMYEYEDRLNSYRIIAEVMKEW